MMRGMNANMEVVARIGFGNGPLQHVHGCIGNLTSRGYPFQLEG